MCYVQCVLYLHVYCKSHIFICLITLCLKSLVFKIFMLSLLTCAFLSWHSCRKTLQKMFWKYIKKINQDISLLTLVNKLLLCFREILSSISHLLFISVLSLLSSDAAFSFLQYLSECIPNIHCDVSQILLYAHSPSCVLPASLLSKMLNNYVLYIYTCIHMWVYMWTYMYMTKVPERMKIYVSSAEIFLNVVEWKGISFRARYML